MHVNAIYRPNNSLVVKKKKLTLEDVCGHCLDVEGSARKSSRGKISVHMAGTSGSASRSSGDAGMREMERKRRAAVRLAAAVPSSCPPTFMSSSECTCHLSLSHLSTHVSPDVFFITKPCNASLHHLRTFLELHVHI